MEPDVFVATVGFGSVGVAFLLMTLWVIARHW